MLRGFGALSGRGQGPGRAGRGRGRAVTPHSGVCTPPRQVQPRRRPLPGHQLHRAKLRAPAPHPTLCTWFLSTRFRPRWCRSTTMNPVPVARAAAARGPARSCRPPPTNARLRPAPRHPCGRVLHTANSANGATHISVSVGAWRRVVTGCVRRAGGETRETREQGWGVGLGRCVRPSAIPTPPDATTAPRSSAPTRTLVVPPRSCCAWGWLSTVL